MNITLRSANENDFEAVLNMIKELALFEKAPEKVTNTVAQMKEEQNLFNCLVAETKEGTIVGMALYYFSYYTWVGKSLYLDDLYITKEFRNQGIATRLLREIFATAEKEKCKRIRWQVINWNAPAIALYQKAGAVIDNAWSNCDFDPKAIAEFKL